MLFDGIFTLCNKTVLFLIKYDKNNNIHFASNQTKAGETIMKQYLVNHEVLYGYSFTVLEVKQPQ